MATKSKVDIKATEQSMDVDMTNDQSQANSDVLTLATECFQDMIAIFGTTEYQAENVARQFVQSAEYLLTYKKEQLDTREQKVLEAEDDVEINAVGAVNRLSRARFVLEGVTAEYNDLLRFKLATTEAYETMIGKKYEPLPKKKAEAPAQRTAAQRLEDARKERGRVAKSAKREGRK